MSDRPASRIGAPSLVLASEPPHWTKDRALPAILVVTLVAVVTLVIAVLLMVGSIPRLS